jgi:Mo25-like
LRFLRAEAECIKANLKMMMNLLRDKSRNIQFEAFHVFKVFVANPKKPPQIESILRRNKDKLLAFLKDFHNDKEGTFGSSRYPYYPAIMTTVEQMSNSAYAFLFLFLRMLTVTSRIQDEKQFLIVQIQGL